MKACLVRLDARRAMLDLEKLKHGTQPRLARICEVEVDIRLDGGRLLLGRHLGHDWVR